MTRSLCDVICVAGVATSDFAQTLAQNWALGKVFEVRTADLGLEPRNGTLFSREILVDSLVYQVPDMVDHRANVVNVSVAGPEETAKGIETDCARIGAR